jgi:hypothetical protein
MTPEARKVSAPIAPGRSTPPQGPAGPGSPGAASHAAPGRGRGAPRLPGASAAGARGLVRGQPCFLCGGVVETGRVCETCVARARCALDVMRSGPAAPNGLPCARCGGEHSHEWHPSPWRWNSPGRRPGPRAFLCADCAEAVERFAPRERADLIARLQRGAPPRPRHSDPNDDRKDAP